MMMVKQSKLVSESGFQRVFLGRAEYFYRFLFLEKKVIPLGHIRGWSYFLGLKAKGYIFRGSFK